MKYSNPKTIEEMERLFDVCPPAELRTHVNEVFFQYLGSLATDAMPPNFKEVCDNLRFLIRFLEMADKNKAFNQADTQQAG